MAPYALNRTLAKIRASASLFKVAGAARRWPPYREEAHAGIWTAGVESKLAILMVKRLGRYEVIGELGRGGFGHVYRGLDPSVGRPVAIKVLTADGDEGMLTRFRGEATASARLRHPNIVTVYDFGEQDGTPFIIMELLEGQDLQRTISSGTPLSILDKLQIMAQIASGLRHAHAGGIIHRDVKPANVMVLLDRSVKIMDFGIALITQSTQSRQTPRGAMIGTLRYMAPEQFRGIEPDVRSDIFAYGLIFYELITGVHPFHATEAAAQMYNVLSVEPVRVTELCSDCPLELVSVVDRLLYKDPDLRYQNLDDVLLDIEPVLQDLRRARADEVLEQARSERQQNQLEAALGLIRQALELAPTHPHAREFREQVQSEIRREAVRPKLDDLVRRGREALAKGNPAEALQKFESAVRLDSTAREVKTLLQQAQEAVAKSQEAARLASSAARALRSGDPAGARLLALQALELAPAETARQVLTEADTALAEEQRKARLADGLARVRRLISIRSWEEASAVLVQLTQEFPRIPELQALSRELRAGQDKDEREKRLAQGLSEARRDIQEGSLDSALVKLLDLAIQHPNSPDAADMLRFVREEIETRNRGAFVQQTLRETAAAGALEHFDRAAELLKSALLLYPDDVDLQLERQRIEAARQEAARHNACQEAIRSAGAMRSQGRFAEALAPLEEFLAAYTPDSAIVNLKETILKEQESARREAELRDFIQRANHLLANRRYEEATALLAAPPSDLKNDPTVTMLLDLAAEQKRQDEERNAALESVLDGARQLSESRSFDQALHVLHEFIEHYGDDAQVEDLRSEIRKSQHDEHQAAAKLASRVEALLARNPEQALAILLEAPDHLRQRAEIQALEHAAGQALEARRITAAVAALLNEAQKLQDAKSFAEALSALDRGLEQFANEPRLLAARKEALAAQEEHARKQAEKLELERRRQEELATIEAIETLVRQAQELRAGEKFAEAGSELDKGLKQFPNDSKLLAARKEVAAAQEQHARKQAEKLKQERRRQEELARLEAERLRAQADHKAALESVINEARQLKVKRFFPQALQILDQFEQHHRGDAQIEKLRTEIQKAEQEEQHVAAKLASRVEAVLATDPSQVATVLRSAAPHLRERPEIQALEQAAARAIEDRRISASVETLIRQAQELKASGDFPDALSALNAGLQEFPNNANLRSAHDEILTARDKRDRELQQQEQERLRREEAAKIEAERLRRETERRTALERVLAEARQLRESRSFERALAVLSEFRERYGAEPQVEQLRNQINGKQQEEQRAAGKLTSRVEGLLARDPEQAAAALRAAPAYLRERPEIQALEQAAVRCIEERRINAAVEGLIRQAQDLEAGGGLEHALSVLDAGLKEFPDQPKLSAARKGVIAAREAREREQAARRERERLRVETRAKVEACLANNQYEDALSALTGFLAGDNTDRELLRLQDEIQERQIRWNAEQAERRLQDALAHAVELISSQPAQAIVELQGLSRDYPGRSEVASALQQATEAAAQKQRRGVFEEVERLCSRHDFETALLRLSQASPDSGGEITAVRQQVEARREEFQRIQAAQAIEGASRLSEREALRHLDALAPAVRQRPEILDAVQRIQAAILAADRQAARSHIEELLSQGKLGKARKAHNAAIARFGAGPDFDELVARISVASSNQPARKPMWAVAAVAGAVALGAGIWEFTHRQPSAPAAVMVPVEIRTDPQGASVQVGDQNCVTPNCKISLKPGSYSIHATLKGYETAQQSLNVPAGGVSGPSELTLRPIPPPPPSNPAQATATLVVEAGAPDALVFVDGAPAGRTNADGKFTSVVPAATHSIRVEKVGYVTPPERRITMARDRSATITLRLAPQLAKVEVPSITPARGGPANTAAATNGGAAIATNPPANTGSSGSAGRLTTNAPPLTPAAPAKSDAEEQNWTVARASSNASEVQSFLDRYPNSQHVSEAQARLENLTWSATNSNDASSLRAYLSRFPNSVHSRDAESKLVELAWSSLNKSDEQALRAFVQQNSGSPHRAEAQTLIDQIQKQRAEAERQAQQKATQTAPQQLQVQGITAAIDAFNSAWEKRETRDLRAVWPGVPKRYLDAMSQSGATLVMSLRPTGTPILSGDTGMVTCNLSTRTTDHGKVVAENQKTVLVQLKKDGDHWLIVDPFASPR